MPPDFSEDKPVLKTVGREQNLSTFERKRPPPEIPEKEEADETAFIQNEQLITICLAALGVTSTGLLMWIAIQEKL